MIETTISLDQKIRVAAFPKNAMGQPAAIQGSLSCGVISGNGTFSVDPMDPLGVTLVAGAAAGDTVYKISGDSNLGGEIVRISENVTLHVFSADATSLNLVAGSPMPK